VLGFRAEQRHCNPAGIVHGGMLMTVADMTAGFCTAMNAGIDKFMPTVNMTFDFVASGNVGDWIEGRSEIMKITRSLAFTTVDLSAAGNRLIRASCIMKIPSATAAISTALPARFSIAPTRAASSPASASWSIT